MSEFTDKNIPVFCSECNIMEEGVDAMMSHILDFHPDYSPEEAATFARKWADDSYDVNDAQQAAMTAYNRRK